MAKADERRAILEEFAEACTAVAGGLANRKLDWESGKEGFVHFHCPTTGERNPHRWNGEPRAAAWLKDDEIRCTCSKCVGDKADYPDQASYEAAQIAYTDRVQRAIRWEQGKLVKGGFGVDILRSHLYVDRDMKNACRRDKVRYKDGRKEKGNHDPWWWAFAPLVDGKPGKFTWQRAEEWRATHYREVEHVYGALRWYCFERFINTSPEDLKVVICEGEKDCDTFNALMDAAGVKGFSATCLAHPNPSILASHHDELLEGRDVVVVGDADEAGRQHAEGWTRLAWGHARSIKLVREQLGLRGTPDDKDLTDWVNARGSTRYPDIAKAIAAELIDLFAGTAPLIEPIGRSDDWRKDLVQTKQGGPKTDSPHNAERVWTMHPLLKGRVRTNIASGEVEVVDPPWGGRITTGAKPAAIACAAWLERAEKLSLSVKMLEEVLAIDAVAPPHNPLGAMLAEAWDGTPRLDGLWTTYVPLNVEKPTAAALARVFMGDLVRKMRGELVSQRALVGIGTSTAIDVAGALLGHAGAQHRGKVAERQVEQFARQGVALVQVSMDVVGNRQVANASLSQVFAAHTWHRARMIASPLFFAVGVLPADPRTDAKIDERCFIYALAGPPRLDSLRADAVQLVAEAAARIDELVVAPVPDREKALTLDAERALEALNHVLRCLWLYVTREVEGVDLGNPHAVKRAALRAEPMRHVVREQFVATMRVMLLEEYREVSAHERAFNAVCRAFGWSNRVGVTPSIAAKIKFDLAGLPKAIPIGVLMTDERLAQLRARLLPNDDVPPPPEGGSGETPGEGAGDSFTVEKVSGQFQGDRETAESRRDPSETESVSRFPGSVTYEKTLDSIDDSHTCRHTSISSKKKGKRWLSGDEAIERVRSILARPGMCAIDFETYPTSPEWHAAEAARDAPRGGKGEAKVEAKLNALMGTRAHLRTACTLQVRHEDGDEVFVRLAPGADHEPRRRELQAMFEPVTSAMPWDDCATLVAHNAQFETEVLLRHGVAVDVECTLIAAKCLFLTAVRDDAPQPMGFSLAELVKKFGRVRDKTIRDRDWRQVESLDDEAVEYGLQDVRDCLDLWQEYERELREQGLWRGYELLARSLLPTAAMNVCGGLVLDREAHASLMADLTRKAGDLERGLESIAEGAIENHGSSQQVGTWIMEQVLGTPIKEPKRPDIQPLSAHLRSKGGLRWESRGELQARDLHRVKGLVRKKGGMSLHDAAVSAQEALYIGKGRMRHGPDASYATEDELLDALERETRGEVIVPTDRELEWEDYQATMGDFEARNEGLDATSLWFAFVGRLKAKTNGAVQTWRRTETGHLAITKGSKLRKAEQLAQAFPHVSDYLIKHAQWTAVTKLLDAFGPTLRRWQDDSDDGRGYVRGQFKAFKAWTGRQSCVDPNLTNQPNDPAFRALWVAKPGRKLVIADYSQIELRLGAIESGDERLREVYREGRDVHQETADIAGIARKPAKGVNFLAVYGGGAAKLAETIGCGLDEAHVILGRFFSAYPGLRKYREDAPRHAKESGWISIRPCRRVAYSDELSSPTQAINAPIQGGAASVQMLALRLVYDALRERPDLDARLAASVHDELILDCAAMHADEAGRILVDGMTRALLEIYPEAEDMGLAQLTTAAPCDRWSEKS